MTKFSESDVRRVVKAEKLEHLLRYDFSNHNNAKGRRAETYWSSLEGERVLEDCNVTQGSQADFDFRHTDYGRVNVKSSKAYKYTSGTRKGNPLYWKISTSGLQKADYVGIVLYDTGRRNPLHVFNVKVHPRMLACSTFRVQIKDGKLVAVF